MIVEKWTRDMLAGDGRRRKEGLISTRRTARVNENKRMTMEREAVGFTKTNDLVYVRVI